MELEATEKNVGPFRADILCRDTANDSLVLIESQLERTDHKHLGQLLTYAAGLYAVTIVWIADSFTDEHWAALDWLNEMTNENVNFFGLEIEIWQIGNLAFALKFNVISKPNEWTKIISGRSSDAPGDLTVTSKLQLEYWQAFRKLILEKSQVIKPHHSQGSTR